MGQEGQAPDYYQLLGVKYGATKEEIEDAYHELARRLHPDVTGEDPELTARYMSVNEAYQVLSRSVEREDYDRALGIEGVKEGREDGEGQEARPQPKAVKPPDIQAQDMRLLDARLRRAIRDASGMCDKGNFWEATRLLEKYLKTHPDNAQLRKALASAALGRKSYHEAVNHMRAACKVEYHDPENFIQLAEIYIEAGQLVLAEKALYEALGWNAEHEGALRMKKRIRDLKDAEKPPLQRIFSRISNVMKR
ncbi:MAG: DnaJ domain-containing protein [Candidatus Fermentibacteraceae bacterium]|nr:DnaJ domain-containing protein [Candidatus Fermentibacteraceae bacterium]MBN2609259.1 DnaJ domain-containing protein [Candidatus Fermentibacteraceae bacterium]